jgi:hypothetical protein
VSGHDKTLAVMARHGVSAVRGCDVGQVKEKFGGLRVYLDCSAPDVVHDRIQAAYDEADRTCEDCGATEGVSRCVPRGWIKTLCEPCAAAWRDAR